MKKNNEEIDLKQILLLIIKFFNNHKLIWITVIIIGIAVGIYKYSTTKIYYQAEMIITSGLVYESSNGIYKTDLQALLSVLSPIEQQVKSRNIDNLKNALNIDEISFLKSFSSSVYNDKAFSKTDPKNIIIKVEVYELEKLEELEQAIVYFCNNNKFINQSFIQQKNYRQKSIKIINDKLLNVDSIENMLNDENLKNNKIIFLNFSEWTDFAYLELNKLKLENLYNAKQPLTVIQNLNTFPQEINKKLKQGVIFFILIIILGIGVAFLIDIIKFLKNE